MPLWDVGFDLKAVMLKLAISGEHANFSYHKKKKCSVWHKWVLPPSKSEQKVKPDVLAWAFRVFG